MKLLTTLAVRWVMRVYGAKPLYTNKTKGHTGNVRRVKCYYDGNYEMLNGLRNAFGTENVTLTSGNHRYYSQQAITVRCVLA